MASRPKRRRLNSDDKSPPDTAKVVIDKNSWNGFCEIESEPAYFNVMLREFGVEGVKVQEVFSLDKEMIDSLPKPVYGLIFLFRWHEDSAEKQEPSCPEGLWFANQTTDNACASVALLNIVNNIKDVKLGDTLASFKEFTMSFTPALRGDAIVNFEFIKSIHNSFARPMDILNSDFALKIGAAASKTKRQTECNSPDEAAFHFVAFVPALGRVWKFDGLERQPHDLGPCTGGDWLEQVRSNLIDRMTGYAEDQIEFSVLSLVRDPILHHVEQLARNVKTLQSLRTRLSESQVEGVKRILGPDDFNSVLLDACPELALTEQCLEDVHLEAESGEGGSEVNDLAERFVQLVRRQHDIRRSILEEMQDREDDCRFSEGKRHDYSDAIERWARALARKARVRDLLAT